MLAERPPGSCDGVRKGRSGQYRTAELFGQVLHPDHFIDRGADDRELQTLRHADIAIDHLAQMQRDAEVEFRS